MQTNPSMKLNAQHALLIEYLRQIRYNNLEILLQADSMDIIKDCFEQFTVFLADTAPLEAWRDAFVQYARDLMCWLCRPEWHVDWVVRSMEFFKFATNLGVIQSGE